MSVYGEALLAYAQGDDGAVMVLERDDGSRAEVPVSVFFRQSDAWSAMDREALRLCRGRVLDVGAGTGIHALWLQEHRHEVTALDLCAPAVDIMRRDGGPLDGAGRQLPGAADWQDPELRTDSGGMIAGAGAEQVQ
jgi:SAM-dependent methyltransferase